MYGGVIVGGRRWSKPDVSPMTRTVDHEMMTADLQSKGGPVHDFRISGASIILSSIAEGVAERFSLLDLMVCVGLSPISRFDYDVGGGPDCVPMPVGGCSLYPPNGDLLTAFEEPCSSILFNLEADLLRRAVFESTGGSLPEIVGRVAFTDPLLAQIGFSLAEDIAAGHPGGRFLQESLVVSMAAWLIRNHSTRPIKSPEFDRGLSSPQLRSAIDYIESHLYGEASLFEIAHAAGLSPYHFARLFRKSTGTSPRQFLLRRRVERAKILIRSHPVRKMSWVAVSVGFHDERHMAKYFARFVGCSPARYRRDQG